MEKVSRFYKQPKMKQKEYIQVLQQRQYNGGPQSLHQLKMQRGAVVQRSYSDVGYRQNFPVHHPRKSASVTRNNSNVSSVSRYSGKSNPQRPGVNGVQRASSDGIRLVNYRDNRDTGSIASSSTTRTNFTRPASASEVIRSQSMAHVKRPASVDFDSRRPRSILKKSSSFNDINGNNLSEQDLIFDNDYLDYVSPRDLLSVSGHNRGYSSSMDYSFEGELGPGMNRETRPLSPNGNSNTAAKRVNFKNEPVYYRSALQLNETTPVIRRDPYEHPMRTSNSLMEQRILEQHKHRKVQSRRNVKASYANNNNTNAPQETPMRIRNGVHNASPSVSTKSNNEQPFEIRKPLVADNNVVDFGTFISKKLSKFKFGSSSGGKKNKPYKTPSHVATVALSNGGGGGGGVAAGYKNGETPAKAVRTSLDGNFTLLSDTGQSNGGVPVRNNFINQEVLY